MPAKFLNEVGTDRQAVESDTTSSWKGKEVERVVGVVHSGRGQAAKHLAGIAAEIEHLLGNSPVPGSLNLVLRKPLALDPTRAAFSTGGGRRFWPVAVEGLQCLAYRWNSCPLHIVEVVSDRHLRSVLALRDGAEVSIELPREVVIAVGPRQRLAWMMLWGWGGSRYYANEAYTQWAKRRRSLWRHTIQGSAGWGDTIGAGLPDRDA